MVCSYVIDANLLVLLAVGTASESFIEKHKRTNTYTVDDFRLLLILLSAADRLIVTPNVLSEASNLLRQLRNPDLAIVLEVFKDFIAGTREISVRSSEAVAREEFVRLGLTDAALLSLPADDMTVMTDDLDLYAATVSKGRPAVNFSHQREQWLGV